MGSVSSERNRVGYAVKGQETAICSTVCNILRNYMKVIQSSPLWKVNPVGSSYPIGVFHSWRNSPLPGLHTVGSTNSQYSLHLLKDSTIFFQTSKISLIAFKQRQSRAKEHSLRVFCPMYQFCVSYDSPPTPVWRYGILKRMASNSGAWNYCYRHASLIPDSVQEIELGPIPQVMLKL